MYRTMNSFLKKNEIFCPQSLHFIISTATLPELLEKIGSLREYLNTEKGSFTIIVFGSQHKLALNFLFLEDLMLSFPSVVIT